MKLILIAVLGVLCICQLSIKRVEAARPRRAISRETCPETLTHEECEAYAKEIAAMEKNTCVRYGVSNNEIVWHSCGVKLCKGSSGNKYRATVKDLTKSYPNCCPLCY